MTGFLNSYHGTKNHPHPGDYAGAKLLRSLWPQLQIPRSFAKSELSKPICCPVNTPQEEKQQRNTELHVVLQR